MALSTDNKVDLAGLAAMFGGGLLGGAAQGKQSKEDRKLSAQGQYLQSILSGNNANPYQQAQFAQQDMMRNALFGGQGNISNSSGSFDPATGRGTLTGGLKLPDNFQQQVQPGFTSEFTHPYADKFGSQLGNAQGALAQSAGLQPNGQAIPDGYEMKNGQLQKKGPGFWGKLGHIALAAAPMVAAPFTGGASLALIGAGAGAANAALSHQGLGGILTGGALGGLTAGATGSLAKNIPGLNTLGKFGQAAAPAAGNAVNPSQYFKNIRF